MATSAIITADIVNSTMFSTLEERKFKDKLNHILKPHRHEFYRGDSFQVYVKDPYWALRMVIIIRAEARKYSIKYDVRSSIGIGEVNPYLKKLSTATDPAFVLSGRSFDALNGTEERIIITCTNTAVNHGFRVIGYFLDHIFQNLTEKQAQVIVELLHNNTQLGVAKRLRKSTSTISKHTHAAGWYEMQRLFTEYDQLISIVINGNTLAH